MIFPSFPLWSFPEGLFLFWEGFPWPWGTPNYGCVISWKNLLKGMMTGGTPQFSRNSPYKRPYVSWMGIMSIMIKNPWEFRIHLFSDNDYVYNHNSYSYVSPVGIDYLLPFISLLINGGVLKYGYPLNHHPFLDGIFPNKNQPFWVPPWPWKPPNGCNMFKPPTSNTWVYPVVARSAWASWWVQL